MRVEISCRDGAGRSGRFVIENRFARIPNIIFLDTDRFPSPVFAEMIGAQHANDANDRVIIEYPRSMWLEDEYKGGALSIPQGVIYPASMPADFHSVIEGKEIAVIPCNDEAKISTITNKGKLFVLANLISLYPKSRIFVKNIVKVREEAGYSSLLFAPGIADPKNLSLLIYMGIDLVDSTKAVVCARKGFLFFPEGNIHRDDLKDIICDCESCRKFKDPKDMEFEDILLHNLMSLEDEIRRIRFFIYRGRLRELVESRISNSPDLIEKFRILNREFYEFLEERLPVVRRIKLKATLRESLNYPEIERFRRRIKERYVKPDSTRILLLLPCSAKKPYSLSKSHRMFRDVILKSENPFIIHEVVVTSPLGIVPRELEMIYPANSYDVPVTGHWFEDEMVMIKGMLEVLKKNCRYDIVISHLPEDLDLLVREVFRDLVSTCKGNPTSKESLASLEKTIADSTSEYDRVSKRDRLLEDIRSVASYQFGIGIANDLIRGDSQIRGSYPNLRVFREDIQICSLSRERGTLSLTLEGARVLVSRRTNMVKIEKDVEIKGSVLAPCVEEADEDIRIEDEVVVLKGDELYAVGIAKMNGREMMELDHGEAVKIRHHL